MDAIGVYALEIAGRCKWAVVTISHNASSRKFQAILHRRGACPHAGRG